MNFGKICSRLQVAILALLLLPSLPMVANALPAFPGAEGFGSTTVGGRGGTVLFVTNTNDSGAGSLRAALTASGPRIVVFKTGGTIKLASTITIRNPYVTVAGQTAPGGGILIRGPYSPGSVNGGPTSININTHDVIIRGLRIREVNRAAISIYEDAKGQVYNIIVDHNSLSWSTDSVMDMWYAPHDVTYSWNIVGEPVGSHNYGMLIGGQDGCTSPGYNISVHHNLLTQNNDRNPLIKQKIGAPEVINNVIYNWNYYGTRTFSTAAIIKNHYIAGRNTRSSRPVYVENGGECPSLQAGSVFISHNIGQGRTSDTGDDWNIVNGSATYRANAPPFTLSGIREDDVANVKSKVLAGAGATVPSRDAVDVRIVNDVNNGTGGYLSSSPDEVGGWPTLSAGTAPTDTDNDGIPDSWETSHGLKPDNASDAGALAPSGYTWIEEYFNSLIPLAAAPPAPAPAPAPAPTLVPNPPSDISIQ